jgi:hypothetical protein
MEKLIREGEEEGDKKRASVLKEHIEARDTDLNDEAKERNQKDQEELEAVNSRIASVEKAKKEESSEKEAAMVPVRKAEKALDEE